jgi:hypothetical protein
MKSSLNCENTCAEKKYCNVRGRKHHDDKEKFKTKSFTLYLIYCVQIEEHKMDGTCRTREMRNACRILRKTLRRQRLNGKGINVLFYTGKWSNTG